MSSNYWDSSQRSHWQYSKDQLNTMRMKIMMWEKQKITNGQLSVRYDTNMRIYIHQMVAKLGRRMMLRQIVLATAEVYISRFSTKVSLLEYNLYMLIATAIYLACKTCESPQHIRTVLSEARNCWPEFICGDFTKLAEFEFYLIEELNCYMLVHHPYFSLTQLVDVLGRENDQADATKERNVKYRLNLTEMEIENAWKIINDSYITDLPLLYPPHVIAIAALHIVLILRWDSLEMEGKVGELSDSKKISRPTPNTNSRNQDPLGPFLLDPTGKNGSRISSSASPTKSNKLNGLKIPGSTGTNFPEDVHGLFNSKQPAPKPQNIQTPNRSTTPKQTQHTSLNAHPRQTNSNQMKNRTFSSNNIGLRRKLSHSVPKSRVGVLHMNPDKLNTPAPRPARLECFVNFLAGSNVNLEEVIDSVQEMLALYEAWQLYDETSVRQNLKFLLTALNNSNPS